MSLRKKLLFSLISITLFFLALEGVLGLIGVRPENRTHDPYVGFSSHHPLMQLSDDPAGKPTLRTAPAKLVWFNEQVFSPSKPPNTRRIICVGGSTTFGRPYSDLTAYSNWLRQLLPVVDRNTTWEVINAGGVSYASYRVAAVMEELSQYQPDLFIVYSAHNEFLERRTYADMFDQPAVQLKLTSALSSTRTWTAVRQLISRRPEPATPGELLPAEVDEVLNHSVGPADYQRDDKWQEKVLYHYQTNLVRMIYIAQSVGARIVFITPASNEKDCSPFKSELPPDLTTDQRERFALLLDRGRRAATRDHEKALSEYQQASQIDDRNPQLLYLMGHSNFSLKRLDQAQHAFRRALNEDICPLRAIDKIVTIIRDTAAEHDIPIVDFEQRLRDKSREQLGHGILGDAFFLDHVHPTRAVHQQLALWIIEELRSNSLLDGGLPEKQAIEAIAEQIDQQIDPQIEGIAMRNLAKVLHWSGKFSEAAPRALDALSLIDNDPESLLILADCLENTGRRRLAITKYQELLEAEPFYLRAILPYAELLFKEQEFALAKGHLELAVATLDQGSEKHFRAMHYLGATLVELGEFDRALPLLREVHQNYPGHTDTIIPLAQASAATGSIDEAIKLYQSSIQLEPNNSQAYQYLGLVLLKQGDGDAAIQHFETALELDPDNEQLRQYLSIARQLK